MASADTRQKSPQPLFPRLSGGPGKLPPEQVARHQRARLEGAMVEAVARHGYAGTTLRELVALAGVSKSTFYEHFEGKQDCFFATFAEIVEIASQRVGVAYRQPGDIRERLIAGIGALVDVAVQEPAAASLVTVESLTLGAAGVAPREKAWETFERMMQQTLDSSPSRVKVSPLTVRTIVAGIRGVIYRHLRDGRRDELPGQIEGLVDWTLRYQRRESAAVGRARRAAEKPITDDGPEVSDGALSWDEPPDSSRSRAALTQRERITRAAARVVFERGYEALTVPSISGAAGVSNQTFYQNYPSKRDAFLEAFEVMTRRAFTASVGPVGADVEGPEAVGTMIRAFLEHVSSNPLFARLAFFEAPSAGPAALDLADATIDQFAGVLPRNMRAEGGGEAPSTVVLTAIGSGIWAVLQHELEHGHADSLPDLAPEIARLALAPLT